MATMFVALMRELGYERFAAAGCDWGAYVTALLGLDHPDAVVGIHMGMLNLRAPGYATHRRGRRVQRAHEGLARATSPATAPSRAPSRSRSRTGSWTHPPASRGGSSRSGDGGPTAPATSNVCSRATSCSRPSPSTGSPARSTAPIACTTRAAAIRSGSPTGERVRPPAGFLLERVVEGTDAQHRPAAPEPGRCGVRRPPLDGGRPGPALPGDGEPGSLRRASSGRFFRPLR